MLVRLLLVAVVLSFYLTGVFAGSVVALTPPDLAEDQVDTPTLTLTQDNTTVTASGEGLRGYRYFLAKSDPDCSKANTTATWQSGKVAQGLADKQWVMFPGSNLRPRPHLRRTAGRSDSPYYQLGTSRHHCPSS